MFTLNTMGLELRIRLGVVHTEHKEIRTIRIRLGVVHTEHKEIRTKNSGGFTLNKRRLELRREDGLFTLNTRRL